MNVTGRILVFCACISLLGTASPLLAEEPKPAEGQAEAKETPKAPPKDIVLKGDAACTSCHDETETYPVLAIGKTRHGVVADTRTPTCASCHGESKNHLNIPKGEKDRPKPDRTFSGQLLVAPADDRVDRYFGQAGRRTFTPVAERNAACIDCHQGGKRIHWQGSMHDTREVACTSCHTIHTAHDKVRDKLTQSEVCYTCHKEQRAQMNRPSRHPVKEGKVACSDCHNPHGSAGVKMLVRDTVVDTCYTCHMEKRGPFIWNHQPVTEDCSICHNPHGTTQANLLKSRPPFLCQQCHEATSHRGGIPSLTSGTVSGTSGRGITLARGCLNCHTNIHGGSNPVNDSTSRSFRR
ncbi:MAG: decaheme c-type cytochrome MtrA [Sulfuricaulis sp.]